MKKLINILIIMLLLIIPVSADEESGGGVPQDSLSTEIYLDLDDLGIYTYATAEPTLESYTWSVPSNVAFTQNGQTITETISVTKNTLITDKLLIKLSSDQTFVLNSTSGSDTRDFTIQKDGVVLNAGDAVLEVNAKVTGQQNIDFVLDNADAIYSGSYANSVTFVANRVSTLISFTIDGTSYYAEEGMTWKEWVNSKYNINEYKIGQFGIDFSSAGSFGFTHSSSSITVVATKNSNRSTAYIVGKHILLQNIAHTTPVTTTEEITSANYILGRCED